MRYAMRAPLLGLGTLLAGIMLALAPAQAHHGWGSYDAGRPLQLTGTVRQITFENPHGLLLLATPDKVWEVVLAPPARMVGRGLSADQITVGATVEVYGYPHRTRDPELRAEWIKVGAAVTQLR